MAESREITKEELQAQFIDHIWAMIDYWERDSRAPTTADKLEGVAFSILTVLHGGTGLPAFIVAPCPHPSDKAYLTDQGENYYADNHEADVACDIAGGLHEEFYRRRPDSRPPRPV